MVTAAELYQRVQAPRGTPYRFGAFSVMEFSPDQGLSELGITWESMLAETVSVTNDICVVPGRTPYSPNIACLVPQFDPFTVYIYSDESIAGMSADEHDARVRERFNAAEQHGVETQIAAILAAEQPAPTAVSTGTSPSEKLLSVLAEVEKDLADLTGVEGVIWMSRFAATLLSGHLTASGGTLRTTLGTRVAAIGGGSLGTTVYGTGPAIGFRSGDIDVKRSYGRRGSNDYDTIAQRTYTVGWDCGTVAATTTL